ncbi:MAG TPA: TonB-dependent receptor [Roseiarcus sp.]|nr:TonB-dependent receptor [Roseiarcus sp.]
MPPFGITGPCAPFNTSFEQDTAGLYLQDQIKLPYDFFFLTGARYQYIKQLSNGYGFGPDYEGETLPSSSQALTPRFGLLWRPKEWVSFYGNYTESFSPNSGVMYPGLPLPPTSAESWEAGLKLEFFDKKLRFGADYFELVKTNTPYQDPDLAHNCGGGPGSCSLVAGATRSNGTEVDVNGEILPGLSVTANYSNIDARFATVSPIYTSVGGPARGERFPGVPRNAANIFTTYEFQKDSVLNGLKIGAGYHYYGSIPVGDYVNPPWVWRLIPSYGTVDLMAAYSWRYAGSKMTAQLNVTNLLDRTYYTGISNQGLLIAGPQNNSYRTYGAPLAVLGSLRAELDEGAAPAPWLLPVPTTGPSQPSFGWTGLYVGGQAGYGWGDNDGSLNWATAQGQVGPGPAGSQIGSGAQGFIGGAHLGYNYQLDQWVLGVEGSVDGTTLNKEILDTQPNLIADPYQEFGVGAEFTGRARTGVQGSLRARGGYAFGRLLPYVTGGLAVGSFNTDTQMVGADPLYAGGMLSGAIPFAASGTKSAMRVGWTLGAGVEYAINNHWSLLGEWRYTDFGYLGNFADPSSVGAIFALNRHLDQQQVQVGFSYRLFADPEPAVAPAIVKGPALAGHVASKPAPQPPFTPVWDGFYLGAQVGYGWGLNDGSITYATPGGLAGQSALGSSAAFVGGETTANGDAIGPMGGVHFGYNRQYGQWVTGLEGSVDPTVMNRNLAISVPDLAADPMGTKGIAATATGSIWSQIQASLRARAGYALDRMLIYGTAGVAFGEFASTFQLYGIDNTTLAPFYAANEHSALRVGWTVGAGVEFAVNPHWSVRGEYRYTDFGQLGDIPAPTSMGAFYTADRHLDQQQVEVGVSYHFNGGATAPLETAVAGGLPSIKGPLSVPSWTPAWSGFYAGANVGGTFWVNATTHAVGADLFDDNAPAAAGGASASSASGRAQASYAHLIGGGQFGYNHQFEGKVVAGLETDIQGVPSSSDGISFTSSAVDPNGSATTMTTFGLFRHSLDYLGTVRGRLGLLATPSLLVYSGGGLAYGGVNFSTTYSSVDAAGFYGVGTGSSSYSNARLGWTGVGGLEWMFAPRWSAKLEYAFYDLGTATTHTVVVGPNTTTGATGYAYAASTSLRFNSNLVRAGLNYHFNWEDALPVVAKY